MLVEIFHPLCVPTAWFSLACCACPCLVGGSRYQARGPRGSAKAVRPARASDANRRERLGLQTGCGLESVTEVGGSWSCRFSMRVLRSLRACAQITIVLWLCEVFQRAQCHPYVWLLRRCGGVGTGEYGGSAAWYGGMGSCHPMRCCWKGSKDPGCVSFP